uniref:CSON005714 protein n=1 Tax=Culicoides sonorensis TaxID=179676 RepID=A0A336L7Z4_CULSO
MFSFKTILEVLCIVFIVTVRCENKSNTEDIRLPKSFSKLYSTCNQSFNFLKCLKVQALKLADKAVEVPKFQLIDGIQIVKKDYSVKNNKRNLVEDAIKLPADQVDTILTETASRFLKSHEIQVNIPRLLTAGVKEGANFLEGRGKKMKKYLGPFVAAVAIKGGILTMVYHSIAIIAGKALIIGKIALVISAIIGLKKLVQPEGADKTTYEIVKKPIIQQSYSSSHSEFDGHEGGQYHRSLGQSNDMVLENRMYKGYF